MTAADLARFVRARLDDLERTADLYHAAQDTTFTIRQCASTPGAWRDPGPCDCPEPNRRRRRAFTHRNLVDWAEAAATAVGIMTVDDFGRGHDPEDVLRHLAAEWSDHPDYLTEWAP